MKESDTSLRSVVINLIHRFSYDPSIKYELLSQRFSVLVEPCQFVMKLLSQFVCLCSYASTRTWLHHN